MQLCVLLSPFLAGCGSASQAPSGDADAVGSAPSFEVPDPVLRTDAGEPLVQCGRLPFPASKVEGAAIGPDRPEIDAALEALERTAGMDTPMGLHPGAPEPEVRILAETPEQMTVAAGDWDESGTAHGQGGSVIYLNKAGAGWKVVGWGDCRLVPALPSGLGWANLTFDGQAPDSATKEIRFEVTERSCSSGRDPGPFLQEPVIVETDRSVTVYWTARLPTAAQECPGNPSAPRTIVLERPLGDRELLDGSAWPARPVKPSQAPASG